MTSLAQNEALEEEIVIRPRTNLTTHGEVGGGTLRGGQRRSKLWSILAFKTQSASLKRDIPLHPVALHGATARIIRIESQMADLEIHFIAMSVEEIGHDPADLLLLDVIDREFGINECISPGKLQFLGYRGNNMMREIACLSKTAYHGGFSEWIYLHGKIVDDLFQMHLALERESLPFKSNFPHHLIDSVLTGSTKCVVGGPR